MWPFRRKGSRGSTPGATTSKDVEKLANESHARILEIYRELTEHLYDEWRQTVEKRRNVEQQVEANRSRVKALEQQVEAKRGRVKARDADLVRLEAELEEMLANQEQFSSEDIKAKARELRTGMEAQLDLLKAEVEELRRFKNV
jgi:chromosome segregation ATPase